MNKSIFEYHEYNCPLSPHLFIYKPQLTSIFSISYRIFGAFLATIVFFFYLLCLKKMFDLLYL
ncbi:Succinate dehydrogenase subunit 3-1, mitochondrial [Capsicum annuum]|uniref:Succinate dehydrogenase subunit 3-1, mitochondrial n=1 Tax=Capsicum annuum TaxID=4072 RepID=A0A2G2ZI29_CAPAN|nr:Succinate dehydrogenase subunit 3-1, mitochondrial [Capsicum annuum]